MNKDRKAFNSTLRPVAKRKIGQPKKPVPRKGFKKPLSLSEVKKKFGLLTVSEMERADLMMLADNVFSKWVRLMAASESDGYLSCFICGIPVHWTEAENMHIHTRKAMSIRFDEVGCKAGCHGCNAKPNGDRGRFGDKLDAMHGQGTNEALTDKSKRTVHLDKEYLKFIIDTYQQRVDRLLKEKGL